MYIYIYILTYLFDSLFNSFDQFMKSIHFNRISRGAASAAHEVSKRHASLRSTASGIAAMLLDESATLCGVNESRTRIRNTESGIVTAYKKPECIIYTYI